MPYGQPGIVLGKLVVGGTVGSVLFVGAGGVLAQDNANFFWDNATKTLRLGGPINISAATAGQIQFPAIQNPSANANTLDDYSESAPQPTLVGSGGGAVANYTARTWNFTKIGNRVFFSGQIAINGIGTIAGNLTISALPWNIGATSSATVMADNLAATAIQSIYGYMATGQNVLILFRYNAGVVTQLTAADLTATSAFYLNGSYRI